MAPWHQAPMADRDLAQPPPRSAIGRLAVYLPSAPPAVPAGGEGRVRGRQTGRGTAHLTPPPLSAHACVLLSGGASPMRQGSLPLLPEGRRGAFANQKIGRDRAGIDVTGSGSPSW